MAEPRPFPPSPRRLALARAAGLTAASPLLVGAAAAAALAGALMFLGRAAAAQVAGWIAAASSAADGRVDVLVGTSSMSGAAAASNAASSAANEPARADAVAGNALDLVLVPSSLAVRVLELALPLVAAAAIAAVVLHVAQTRSLWLPRRRIPSAPIVPRHDVARSALDMLGACVIAAVCVGWLWSTAPQLAALVQLPRDAGIAIASLVVTLAIAWVALGILDALVRHLQLSGALAMTRDEKREDDRLAAADPRWRAQRLSILRGGGISDAVARSVVVLVGDDIAVSIAWDPHRQVVPLRTATGRRARATQLIGLARRHRIAVHRDADLAARLVTSDGPVPDGDWPRLAELVAAIRRG